MSAHLGNTFISGQWFNMHHEMPPSISWSHWCTPRMHVATSNLLSAKLKEVGTAACPFVMRTDELHWITVIVWMGSCTYLCILVYTCHYQLDQSFGIGKSVSEQPAGLHKSVVNSLNRGSPTGLSCETSHRLKTKNIRFTIHGQSLATCSSKHVLRILMNFAGVTLAWSLSKKLPFKSQHLSQALKPSAFPQDCGKRPR